MRSQNDLTEKASLWRKVGSWLILQAYPYAVPLRLRNCLQDKLRSRIDVLNERARIFDAEIWGHLTSQLEREDPVDGFSALLEILEFELDVAGIRFPVRSTATGKVLCGHGVGGYVSQDRLENVLAELDTWYTSAAQREVVRRFVEVRVAAANFVRQAALDAIDLLERRTSTVVETVTRANNLIREVTMQELDAEAAAIASRLDGKKGQRAAQDASETIRNARRRVEEARSVIADALASLAPIETEVRNRMDDAEVWAAWKKVAEDANSAGLPLSDVKTALETARAWNLTPWQQHAEKRELFRRLDEQTMVAQRLSVSIGGKTERQREKSSEQQANSSASSVTA